METNYIEFKCLDENPSRSMNSIMNKLHGYMRHTGKNIGVSFPEYTPTTLGTRVRVFGTDWDLQGVLNNDGIKCGVSKLLFLLTVYTPTLVPIKDAEKVRFVTNRMHCNEIDKAFIKKKNRYEKRHEEEMTIEHERSLKLSLLNKYRKLPYFTRMGDNKTYPIYVEKVPVKDGVPCEFNSHGLGNSGGFVYKF